MYLSEIRSVTPDDVHVMHGTHCHSANQKVHYQHLHATAVCHVSISSKNQHYLLRTKPTQRWNTSSLQTNYVKKKMDRTLIFTVLYKNIINTLYFKLSLRTHWLEPPNSPKYVKYRVVDMITHSTHPSVKEKNIEQFTSLRVVIATVAFGNCPDI